jgi:hypothetical protein
MRVARIGHASLIVEAGDVSCLMDPVLVDSFECGANSFFPAVKFDHQKLARRRFNVVCVSHEHMDHFSVASLHRLDRRTPILYPRGAKLVEFAAESLGFRDKRPLGPGETLVFGPLSITATPSAVSFPEMGLLFRCDGVSFWNAVDSTLDERAKILVRKLAGRPDLMFAFYQPLIETPMSQDALGGEFPYDRYGELIRDVADVNPRCVTPGSCGVRYSHNEWQNQRGFPMTETQFLEDISNISPGIVRRAVPHGAAIHVGGDFPLSHDYLDFVSVSGGSAQATYDWRPHSGVPDLIDRNPRQLSATQLRQTVRSYFDESFLQGLVAAQHALWLERMTSAGAVWDLEIVYPCGEREVRQMDFARRPLSWQSSGGRFAKIVSAIPASTVVGLLEGDVNLYSANLDRRVALRLYEPRRSGVTRVGSIADEPLTRILFPGADRRCVLKQLRDVNGDAAPLAVHGGGLLR